jgi:hypothetical protein
VLEHAEYLWWWTFWRCYTAYQWNCHKIMLDVICICLVISMTIFPQIPQKWQVRDLDSTQINWFQSLIWDQSAHITPLLQRSRLNSVTLDGSNPNPIVLYSHWSNIVAQSEVKCKWACLWSNEEVNILTYPSQSLTTLNANETLGRVYFMLFCSFLSSILLIIKRLLMLNLHTMNCK